MDVDIKCPKQLIRKRQFTMHLVFNTGSGDNEHGWCNMVYRGNGQSISDGEKKCKGFWHDKARNDKYVMRVLAIRFVDFKIEMHGDDEWVILIYDNLSAHLDDEIISIFAYAKVLMRYFPLNMTNFIQTIDTCLGRSVILYIRHALDD